MTLNTWLIFVGTAFIATLLPGPSATLALAHGAQHGLRRALFTITGINLAVLLMMLLSAGGAGLLLHEAPQAFAWLQKIGSLLLLVIAFLMWRSPATPVAAASVTALRGVSATRLLATGFLTSISNPKALVFFFALFPQFMTIQGTASVQFTLLVVTWLVCEFAWLTVYAVSGKRLMQWLAQRGHERWLQRVCAAVLVFIALSIHVWPLIAARHF